MSNPELLLRYTHQLLHCPPSHKDGLQRQISQMVIACGGGYTITTKPRTVTVTTKPRTAETEQLDVMDVTVTIDATGEQCTYPGMHLATAKQVVDKLEDYKRRHQFSAGYGQ